MVHTRGQGARPEGFSEYQPAKREKKSRPITSATQGPLKVDRAALAAGDPVFLFPDVSDTSSETDVETEDMAARMEKKQEPEPEPKYHNASTQTSPKHHDTSTQTDSKLTRTCQCHLVPTSVKRRREVDGEAETTTSKRRKAVTPDRAKFLFSKTRNRSLLTSAPPKLSSRNESSYFGRAVEPASPEPSLTAVAQRPSSQERRRPPRAQQTQPDTPARNAAPQGGLFGSVRKIFGYFRGGAQGLAENEVQPQQRNVEDRDNDASAVEGEEEVANQDSLTPTPRRVIYELESPTPESEAVDSRIFTREHFKRRRTANTNAGRQQIAAMNESSFHPASAAGSNKRKLASVDGQIPGPKGGGFGIDDSYLDCDNEVEGIGESSLIDTTEPATPTGRRPPQTPLRSALRQTGNNFSTIGRSGKSVRINSVPTSAKAVYGQYGPAGDYRGSTFADLSSQASSESPSTVLDWDVKRMHSGDTLQNTFDNTPHYGFDPSVKDPTNNSWRPSAGNPRPGQFVLPDYDDEEYDDEEVSAATPNHGQGEVPSQPPSTPRMSHAELPPTSPSEYSGPTGHTDSVNVNDTHELRLNKARSEAQKYKPAKSSRLSLSEQARSRSSSPPSFDSTFRESQLESGTPDRLRPRSGTSPPTPEDTSMRTASTLDSPTRAELDNWSVGEDGMTDYQREHQYDAWAEDIFKIIPPQTYKEAGIASFYVENLVQKTWTERDTRESVEFWEREFEEGLRAARDAEEQGRELVWITHPDEIVELEQGVY